MFCVVPVVGFVIACARHWRAQRLLRLIEMRRNGAGAPKAERRANTDKVADDDARRAARVDDGRR